MALNARRVGFVGLVGALAGCIPLESEGVPKKNPDFLVVGHRGAPNEAAENTLPSYAAALALGAEALEIDLCVTADGVVVIWHDRDPDEAVALARQSGLEGLLYAPSVPAVGDALRRPVDELTLAELVSSHGYVRSGESERDPSALIPTLPQVLTWARTQPTLRRVYLDIKVDQIDHAALILDQVAAAALPDVELFAMSIRREIVEAMIARPVPRVRVVYDHEEAGALEASEELGLRDLSIGLTALRSETAVLDDVDTARAARDKKRIDSITVWTIDSDITMTLFLYHRVDAILTNDPARLRQIWQATL